MGRIYFNEETGEFWQSSWRVKKPPEGFKPTSYKALRSNFYAESYFCPECGKYHPVVQPYARRRRDLPLWKIMMLEMGSKYGCTAAEKIVRCGMLLGGWERHYRAAEKIILSGHGERDAEVIARAPKSLKRWAVKRVLNGGDIKEVLRSLHICAAMLRKTPLD